MEKTVTSNTRTTQQTDVEETGEKKPAPKKRKGPKTVFKDDLVSMTGDPLNLHVPLSDEPAPTFDVKEKVKSRDDIVVERYNPDVKTGLSTADVELRQMAGMANVTDTGSTKSVPGIIFSNLFTFFNFLNFSIAAWLISVGSEVTNLLFLVVITLNLVIGIVQEIRAKKTIDRLSLLSAPTANVVRNSDELEVAVTDVVLDDIFVLSSGRQITADAVVRKGALEVDESLLTGESDPIPKNEGDPLFSGSYVVSGHAWAQVSAVGRDIYIQKLTSQAKKYKKPKSDLLGSLKLIIRLVGAIILPLAGTLFFMMWENSTLGYREIVMSTSGAMIGMIPSGLFLLTSMALAVGVIRLSQNNTLVQELYCIEMLARVDTLCLDKTGTITDGTMSVKGVIEYDNPTTLSLKQIISGMLNAQGDQNLTSEALIERFGTGRRIRHKATIPFSSARKFSAVHFDRYGVFALGAPEFVLDDDTYGTIEKDVERHASEGMRVLVLAHSDGTIEGHTIEGALSPVALIMIEDTIRPDAGETIEYFKTYGVEIKVISGDNPATVARISQRAGVEGADNYISLDGMADKEVVRAASRHTVFGRVSPHQKKLLIESMKNNGRTVAMTGDGVNDILALKEADTSIAMASGSEAARNVAHLVLLDSNFSSMPKVVSEGRRVINNVQRVSALFLTKTIFSFLLALIAIARRGVYPIEPRQLLLIDWLVIGLPAFLLALEPNTRLVTGSFLKNVMKSALPAALVVVINSLVIFALAPALDMGTIEISTLVVISATVTSLSLLYRVSVPFNTMRIILFTLMVSLFILAVTFIPFFFKFAPFYPQNYNDYAPLSLPQMLLLLVLVQATPPLMFVISNSFRWVKTAVRAILNKLADL